MRTYGYIAFESAKDSWLMTGIPPNVAIRLKQLFPRIPKHQTDHFKFSNEEDQCADLSWFVSRYPMTISDADRDRLNGRVDDYNQSQFTLESILTDDYVPPSYAGLKPGQEVRVYQGQAVEVVKLSKCLLLGDDLGLGKTYSSIALALAGLQAGVYPAAVVVQTHLQDQWAIKIDEFCTLTTHCIKGTRPYPLPKADIYIFKYSQLLGWIDIFKTAFFKIAIGDEIQELRTGEASQKGKAAKVLFSKANLSMGLSATPIFGYGNEIWNIYDCMGSNVLGTYSDFSREWLIDDRTVKDPDALGAYLREQHVFLRRLKKEVGQYGPPVNVLPEMVECDSKAMEGIETIATRLAHQSITGSFTDRGTALRKLDMMVRHATGVGKARYVAALARIILQNNTPLVLCGWHRDVYDIWLKELAEFNPVMYTGSESPKQKRMAEEAFKSGKTNLFIISNRSGAGLDGLQYRCSWILFGELDWSKKVCEQLIGRLDREGQKEQVTAIFANCDEGSDPPILDVLALKESQSTGIVDPGKEQSMVTRDYSRLKLLAKNYLSKTGYKDLLQTDESSLKGDEILTEQEIIEYDLEIEKAELFYLEDIEIVG